LSDEPSRSVRSDAARNRAHLLAVATRVISAGESAGDGAPSMRAIAAAAGVGIATLYRHFPTREALVEAVYRDQVARLVDGAQALLGRLPPPAALRRWMDLFGEWIAAKQGMLDTLRAVLGAGEISHAQTRTALLGAIAEILEAGRATGELRGDVTAEDVAASLIGIFTVAPQPTQTARAERLLDLLLDGLRPPVSTRSAARSG
jgi:AcrR family transcriptional regulator